MKRKQPPGSSLTPTKNWQFQRTTPLESLLGPMTSAEGTQLLENPLLSLMLLWGRGETSANPKKRNVEENEGHGECKE